MEDDIAFSLLSRRKHLAVNVEPIEDLGMSDGAALHLQPEHYARRQAAVEKYAAHVAAAGAAERAVQEKLQAAERELAALRAARHEEQKQLRALRAAHAQLAGSAAMRMASALKRLPLVYPAYLKGKSLKSLLKASPG